MYKVGFHRVYKTYGGFVWVPVGAEGSSRSTRGF